MTTAADLCTYLADSPTPHHAVATSMQRLAAAGFSALDERERWPSGQGAFMVARQGSLVAWRQPARCDPAAGLRMVGAHTDSPNLRLKPHPDPADSSQAPWRQVAIETYGSVLWNSWLDRDLGIAGILMVAGDDRSLTQVLVRVDEPWLRIPQLAIHLDRDVNSAGLRLDPQQHLSPAWGLAAPHDSPGIVDAVAQVWGVDPARVVSSQLMLHDLAAPTLAGRNQEFVASARIDNLVSCWAAVTALSSVDAGTDAVTMICLYDHEEVGSVSTTGAGSTLVTDVIDRITATYGLDTQDAAMLRASSMAVSADGAHATHPNYPERHDPGHTITIDGGIVVKHNANQRYATDASGTAWLRTVAAGASIPLQDFVMRNDMACGSTIGPISAANLGVTTVDLGVAQLAMHSAREMCGSLDAERLVVLLGAVLSG